MSDQMTEWFVQVANMVPNGQLSELVLVTRADRETGKVEFMMPTMQPSYNGEFFIPQSDSPFGAIGIDAFPGKDNKINALLQAFLDCAWARGLRPTDLESRSIANVSYPIRDVTSDIGTDEKKTW